MRVGGWEEIFIKAVGLREFWWRRRRWRYRRGPIVGDEGLVDVAGCCVRRRGWEAGVARMFTSCGYILQVEPSETGSRLKPF